MASAEVARDWLERTERRPERLASGRWRWARDFNIGDYHELPNEVYRWLTGADVHYGPVYNERQRAMDAAVWAVQVAIHEGWEPGEE